MDEAGQSSLADAMLFFLVLSSASVLLLGYVSFALDANAVLDREAGLRYVAGARVAVLRSTLENATYENGTTVVLGTITVERWILEQLFILGTGVPAAAFERGNLDVWRIARSAIRADYGFALVGRTDLALVTVSSLPSGSTSEPALRYEAAWTYAPMDGFAREGTIRLSVWPVAADG